MLENLLEKATAGDKLAILELIEQDEEVLYPIAYTYLKNEQDALDAMQEMTYKALKKCTLLNSLNLRVLGSYVYSSIVVTIC